ncbi:hypothetical protein HWV62_9157 [Athelia sp. TMB]|nr:hypothetical protein HWV62_9157 [Athelia sp. TMB]
MQTWQASYAARRRRRSGPSIIDLSSTVGPHRDDDHSSRSSDGGLPDLGDTEMREFGGEGSGTGRVDEWRSGVDRSHSGLRYRGHGTPPLLPHTPLSPTAVLFSFDDAPTPTIPAPSSPAIRVAGPPSSVVSLQSTLRPSDSASQAPHSPPFAAYSPPQAARSLSFAYDAQALHLSPPVLVGHLPSPPTSPFASPFASPLDFGSGSALLGSGLLVRPSHPNSAVSERPDTPFSALSLGSATGLDMDLRSASPVSDVTSSPVSARSRTFSLQPDADQDAEDMFHSAIASPRSSFAPFAVHSPFAGSPNPASPQPLGSEFDFGDATETELDSDEEHFDVGSDLGSDGSDGSGSWGSAEAPLSETNATTCLDDQTSSSSSEFMTKLKILPHLDHTQRLPSELLSDIFVQTIPYESASHFKLYAEQVVRITHVCARWRMLGLTCSSLWTYLSIDSCLSIKEEMVETWLLRSKTLPLTLFVNAHWPHRRYDGEIEGVSVVDKSLELLAPHCARWKRVTISLAPVLPDLIVLHLTNNLPLLEEIYFYYNEGIPDAFRATPKLQKVTISPTSILDNLANYPLPWAQLTSVTIDAMRIDTLFDMLPQLENIKELNVSVCVPEPAAALPAGLSSDRGHIQITSLISLTLGMDGDLFGNTIPLDAVFERCTFPSLTSLDFRGQLYAVDEDVKLAAMLKRSSTINPLERLTLEIRSGWASSEQSLSLIFAAAPNVVELRLNGNKSGYLTAIDKTLDILTISDGRCLLPKLRTLEYGPRRPTYTQGLPCIGSGEALADMIESRRIGGCEAVGSLNAVRIDCLVGYLKPIVDDFTASALAALRYFGSQEIFSIAGMHIF